MKLQPRCKVCGEEMELVDQDLRRWHCKKDGVCFLASRGGWTIEEHVVPAGTPLLSRNKVQSRKSYSAGVALNFILPGAGIMYAGNKEGIVYPILILSVLIVTPTIALPLIILIAVTSYAHTFIAITERNVQIQRAREPNTAKPVVASTSGMHPRIPMTTDASESVLSYCRNCGHILKPKSIHCPHCGLKSSKETLENVGSDKTRVYE